MITYTPITDTKYLVTGLDETPYKSIMFYQDFGYNSTFGLTAKPWGVTSRMLTPTERDKLFPGLTGGYAIRHPEYVALYNPLAADVLAHYLQDYPDARCYRIFFDYYEYERSHNEYVQWVAKHHPETKLVRVVTEEEA